MHLARALRWSARGRRAARRRSLACRAVGAGSGIRRGSLLFAPRLVIRDRLKGHVAALDFDDFGGPRSELAGLFGGGGGDHFFFHFLVFCVSGVIASDVIELSVTLSYCHAFYDYIFGAKFQAVQQASRDNRDDGQ